MRRLASEPGSGLVRWPIERTGARRDSTDIIVALHQSGSNAPLRATLSKDQVPVFDDVVQAVRDRLRANPYPQGRRLDEAKLAHIVRLVFSDVASWPFAALVSDDLVDPMSAQPTYW